MTRKTTSSGTFGKGLKNLKKKEAAEWRERNAVPFEAPVGSTGGRSVLEQTNLEDLIATVAMRKEEYAEDWGEADLLEGPILITTDDIVQAEDAAVHERDLVSIPRRPKWQDGMTHEELAALEHEAFVNWRRELADIAATHRLHLTPFERNLDFWRQLWRCMERSDLLVEIVDARDPDFYQCRDLPCYLTELGGDKKHMLLINKADFLSRELRRQWADHFAQRGVSVVFFSALLEVQSQAKRADGKDQAPLKARAAEAYQQPEEDTEQQQPTQGPAPGQWQKWAAISEDNGAADDTDATAVPVPGLDDSDDDLADEAAEGSHASQDEHQAESADEEDDGEDDLAGVAPCGEVEDDDIVVDASGLIEELLQRLPISDADSGRRGTIGFVGYPNVGKSTVINALVGSKRVGMSSTPGKTKHIQTLEVPSLGITFCDCPGLVFPSVAATRAHLVINNTVPLDDLRECWPAIALIVDKVGMPRLLEQYKCKQYVVDAAKRSGDHRLDDSHSFLAAYAVARHHFLRAGVPDENWAARKVLRDYVVGALLHCELPTRLQNESEPDESAEAGDAEPAMGVQEELDIVDDDDFDAANMIGAPDARTRPTMTKRKQRQLQKQMNKGAPPKELPNSKGGGVRARGQQLAW